MAVPSAPRILLLLAFSISCFSLVSLPLRTIYPRVLVMGKEKKLLVLSGMELRSSDHPARSVVIILTELRRILRLSEDY
jgi:hypothetical protein